MNFNEVVSPDQTQRSHTPQHTQKAYVKRWEHSGLNAADFCRRYQLNPDRFNYWKKKYAGQIASSAAVEIPSVEHKCIEAVQLVKLTSPNGFCIEFPNTLEPTLMLSLIKGLMI